MSSLYVSKINDPMLAVARASRARRVRGRVGICRTGVTARARTDCPNAIVNAQLSFQGRRPAVELRCRTIWATERDAHRRAARSVFSTEELRQQLRPLLRQTHHFLHAVPLRKQLLEERCRLSPARSTNTLGRRATISRSCCAAIPCACCAAIPCACCCCSTTPWQSRHRSANLARDVALLGLLPRGKLLIERLHAIDQI